MLLIREVFYCRPGKVRPLVEKFQAMNRIMANTGQPSMRLMTDFTGERYWTLVAEFETPGLAEFEKMMQGEGMSEFKSFAASFHQRFFARPGAVKGVFLAGEGQLIYGGLFGRRKGDFHHLCD